MKIEIACTKDERDWIKHAARLRRLSLVEYVKRAINASLCREGVDAVLLKESNQIAGSCECTDPTPDVRGCHCRACGRRMVEPST